MQELVIWKPTNKQSGKRNASCSTDGARARGVLQQHMRTASSIAKLRSHLESAPVEIEKSCQLSSTAGIVDPVASGITAWSPGHSDTSGTILDCCHITEN